jgi:hypothetical protein
MTNVALGRPAIQKSTYFGNPAALAVDGSISLSSTSCTYSTDEPWWAVDIGNETYIFAVNVTNDGNPNHGIRKFSISIYSRQLSVRYTLEQAGR